MNKKLLAALILSLAMAAPQANADPSALEQALNDPNVEKFLLPSDQSISADLPITSERLFELNDFDTPTGDNYYNIIGNGHSGFGDNSNGVYDLTNVRSISGFKTKASASNPNGDGGAFFLNDDSCLVVLSNNFDADKEPLMTTISDNYASGKGGAIYANYNWGGGVYLANTNVIDNVAGDKGGGLYLDWGINKIVALPGTNVVIADNLAYINGSVVNNDIYLSSPRKPQNSGGIRGTLSLVTSSTVEDPSSSVPTGAGNIIVGDLRAEGSSDIIIGSSSHENSAIGLVDIGSMSLDNDAMFSTQKVSPDSKTNIYISDMYMYRDSIINTVNGYIDDNLHITNILLDKSDNKFMVDASLMNDNRVIDSFGTIRGGTGKLAVNIIGSDTTSGTVRLSSHYSTATFAESTTQYGGLKYTFTQDPNDKGIFYYTTTKDRSVTLQEALKDYTLTEYDMPDLTVADEDLGPMYHYNPDTGEFVERTFTINGNGGILITDGQEREGISIPTQLYPPEEDSLTPKLVINDLELMSGFTRKASNLDSFGTGGALDIEDSVLELNNVTFSDNIATGAGTAVDNNTFGMGGAVYIATKDGNDTEGDPFKSIINDSTFLNNKAISTAGSGTGFGGMVSGGGGVFSKGNLDINDSLFANNTAISAMSEGMVDGGALYVSNNSNEGAVNRDINITNTMFMSNIAGDVINEGDALLNTTAYGGAISASRVDMNISDSSFVNNIAQAASYDNGYTVLKGEAQGGAIYIDKFVTNPPYGINIDNTSFVMNEARVVDSQTLSTDDIDQSKAYGGAIAIMPSSAINKMTVNITDSDFVANKSGRGGAIYNAGSNVIIKDSTFSGNQANHYCFDSPTTNESDMNGGAIYNSSGAKLSLDGVTFSSNYAKKITGDTVATAKNDIRNDATSSFGGGLYFIGDASTLDGGIVGNGYTYFNLGLDEYGNPDPTATETTMYIDADTTIEQGMIQINGGTVNIADAGTITARSGIVVGQNGILNIGEGQFVINNTYVREFENNGIVNVESGGFDFIADNVNFTNYGTLITSGTLDRDLTGTLNLNDTLNVLADHTISSIANPDDPSIVYAGILDMGGQIINMQDADLADADPAFVYGSTVTPNYNVLSVGNLEGTGYLKIDAGIGEGVPALADKITVTDGTENDATLVLRSINIKGSLDNSKTDYITFLDGNTSGINVALGTEDNDGLATITSGGKLYKFTKNASTNNLDVTISDPASVVTVSDFITGNITDPDTTTTFAFDNSVYVTDDIGTTAGRSDGNRDLYLELNGHKLIAVTKDTAEIPQFIDGITVDDGYSLDVDNGTVQGFTTAFTVEEGGVLNLSDVTLSDNLFGIESDGEVNFTGTNYVEGGIVGTGDIYINGDATELTVTDFLQGTVHNGGDLHIGSTEGDTLLDATIQNGQGPTPWQQDGGMTFIDGNVFASDDAEIRQYITITEDGNLAINADQIGYGETQIVNAGGLNLGDGTIGNQVAISGDGVTEITGDVINNGNLSTQLVIDEEASFTTGTNNLNAQGTIVNDGDLAVNGNGWFGSTLNNDIEGEGTTTLSGNLTTNGDIDNDVVIASGNVTSNGDIEGTVTNNANFTNNGDVEGTVVNKAGAQLNGSGTMDKLINNGSASIAADSVSGEGSLILNEGDLTLNGSTSSPFGPTPDPLTLDTKVMGIDGTTTLTGNIDIEEGTTISQETVNIGNSSGFGWGSNDIENNGHIIADELNITSSGFGSTTLTNGEDGSIVVMDDINISGNGFGQVELVNESSIYADNIVLGNNASLTLAEGSDTRADIVLEEATGFFAQDPELNVEAGAVLHGDLNAEDGELNFIAGETTPFVLSEAIDGDIIGSDYVVNTDGNGTMVVLDKDLTGATELNASGMNLFIADEDDTSTSDRIGSAQINLDEDSELIITTEADNYTVNNSIEGDDDSAVLLVGEGGTPGSATDTGTQFSIAEGTTISEVGLGLASGELMLPDESQLDEVELAVLSGATLNTENGQTSDFNSDLVLADGAQVKVDVNAATGKADFFANVSQDEGDNAILTDVDLQDLSKIVNHTTKVNLSEATGIGNLTLGDDLLNKTFTAMTPIKRMTASFDEDGMMTILPTSNNNNNWKEYNPAVLAAPIAAQFGGYLTQLNSYNQAFSNMDMYMMMPRAQRTALKFQNKIASTQGDIAYDPTNSPNSTAAGWFRPFASYEKTSLHHGPEVESTAYGSYIGGDSSLKDLGHGWEGMWGAYVGYNGSHQSYDSVGIYQNGGTLGLVGMAFKDNFFVGGTINSGASAGEASTSFGSEEFAMLMAGAAVKAGYNWELANGKFIIQPSLMTAYTFVNTFNYRNAAGVAIESDPLHAVTIEPGVKFIGNLKNGWQPYAGISLVYTIMDRSDVMANDIALPNISINPYVKYGVGVRKTWGERLSGFLQTFVTNGGRNGIGVQAGFRFAIGKDGSNNIKGQTPELKPTKISLNNKK